MYIRRKSIEPQRIGDAEGLESADHAILLRSKIIGALLLGLALLTKAQGENRKIRIDLVFRCARLDDREALGHINQPPFHICGPWTANRASMLIGQLKHLVRT